jgi:hypothetical protein
MSKTAQRREQKYRLAFTHFLLRRARHGRTTNTHTRHRTRYKLSIRPPVKLTHDGIQHLDPEPLHFHFRARSDIDPQIIERRQRRIRNPPTLQVCALDDDNSRHNACTRQHSDSLSFMKLDPQRMLSPSPNLAQSEVTIVSNFSDGKTGPIERTRNHTSRTATAFPQDEIAKRITFPPRHRSHDRVGREVLPTRRRVERDPTA